MGNREEKTDAPLIILTLYPTFTSLSFPGCVFQDPESSLWRQFCSDPVPPPITRALIYPRCPRCSALISSSSSSPALGRAQCHLFPILRDGEFADV